MRLDHSLQSIQLNQEVLIDQAYSKLENTKAKKSSPRMLLTRKCFSSQADLNASAAQSNWSLA